MKGRGFLLIIIRKVAVRIREKLEGDKYTTAKINITFYAFTSGSAMICYSAAIFRLGRFWDGLEYVVSLSQIGDSSISVQTVAHVQVIHTRNVGALLQLRSREHFVVVDSLDISCQFSVDNLLGLQFAFRFIPAPLHVFIFEIGIAMHVLEQLFHAQMIITVVATDIATGCHVDLGMNTQKHARAFTRQSPHTAFFRHACG